VSEARLRTALRDARPDRGARRRGFAELAKALGVEASRLDAAMTKVHEAERKAFAADLAEKLGISEAKVEEELAAGPGPGFGRNGGPGGRGGPGPRGGHWG
jgi:hypothetical protein